MKHPDVRPQRAEIFALLLACRHFTSPWMLLTIVRRWCMELVLLKSPGRRILSFPSAAIKIYGQQSRQNCASIPGFLRPKRMSNLVAGLNLLFSPVEMKQWVDALAKSKAKQLADICFHEFSQCLYGAVNFQTHIVSSSIARAEHATNGAFNMFDDSAHVEQPTISVSRPCSCPPLSRCRGKVQACRGICN